MTERKRKGALRRAAESGDYERELIAVRDLISTQLDSGETSARDLASLTKRYMDVCQELDELKAKKAHTDPALQALHVPMAKVGGGKRGANG